MSPFIVDMIQHLGYFTFVMSPQEPASDPQREYKLSLRYWLKQHRLSIDWLAVNIGKSPGTVKNWLYNTMPITEENQDHIELLQNKIENNDLENIIFDTSSQKKEKIGYVLILDPNTPCSLLADYMPPLDEWEQAAKIEGRDFAEWNTEIVMGAVKEVLKKEKEKVESNGGRFSLSGYNRATGGDFVPFEYLTHIPVLIEYWKPDFLQVAANLAGYDSCEDFIIEHLIKASKYAHDMDLDNFLSD